MKKEVIKIRNHIHVYTHICIYMLEKTIYIMSEMNKKASHEIKVKQIRQAKNPAIL